MSHVAAAVRWITPKKTALIVGANNVMMCRSDLDANTRAALRAAMAQGKQGELFDA